MNCEEIQEQNLPERFLLGELSGQLKKEYEAHLRNCPDCRRKQDEESRLIADIRSASHQAMKAEIMKQTEIFRANQQSQIKYYIMRAAAVLLIAVFIPGLYYYYNQYSVPMENTAIQVEREETEQPGYELMEEDHEEGVVAERKSIGNSPNSASGSGASSGSAKKSKEVNRDNMEAMPASRASIKSSEEISRKKMTIEEPKERSVQAEENAYEPELLKLGSDRNAAGKTGNVLGGVDRSIPEGIMAESAFVKPLKLEYPGGTIMLFKAQAEPGMKTGSGITAVMRDSVAKIYWPRLPDKYLNSPNSARIEGQAGRPFILFFAEEPEYLIMIDSSSVKISPFKR